MIRSVDLRQKEKQILDKVLGPTVYDRRIRPGSGNLTSSKKIQTDRILMLNRAWKGVRTCIVTENPLAFRFRTIKKSKLVLLYQFKEFIKCIRFVEYS